MHFRLPREQSRKSIFLLKVKYNLKLKKINSFLKHSKKYIKKHQNSIKKNKKRSKLYFLKHFCSQAQSVQ